MLQQIRQNEARALSSSSELGLGSSLDLGLSNEFMSYSQRFRRDTGEYNDLIARLESADEIEILQAVSKLSEDLAIS
jgi:hypothetical protein